MAAEKKALLDTLKDLAHKTYEIEETIKNFTGPEAQAVLEDRLLNFVNGVGELRKSTHALDGVKVPVDMLQYVDNGGNPHMYTAEVFQACTRDNQLSKGKVQAVQQLYDSLLGEMERSSPDLVAAYKTLLEQSQKSEQAP